MPPVLTTGWPRVAALVTAGAVAGLGQAPWNIPLATFAALAFVFSWRPTAGPRPFVAGFAVGLGYTLMTLHWIVQPFMVDPVRDGWMAPFALVFMAAGFAAFWGAAFWGAARVRPGSALALAVAWVGVEYARSVMLTGFPWVLLGHIWIDTPAARLAAYVGPHGLTVLTFGLVLLTVMRWRWVAAGPVVAILFLQGWPTDRSAPDTAGRPIVRLVQPNAPQNEKWDPARARVFYDRLVQATGADPRPDLIVWPETSLPYLLEYATAEVEEVADLARGAPVVIGTNRRDGDRFYNAAIVVGPGGAILDTYDKVHLVPFGEYIPLGEWAARFGITGLAASHGGGFTPGAAQRLLTIPGVGRAQPLICYEGIFAQEVNAGPDRADFILLMTNDAWFGRNAGPRQHLAQARLRAIEQGLPVVRVANTGISAMIDPTGRILDSLSMGIDGHMDVALPVAHPPTVYRTVGDWPFLLLLILGAGVVWVRRRNVD